MATITIKGGIYGRKEALGNGLDYTFFGGTLGGMESHGYISICEHTVVCELPADFNPIAAEVESLNRAKEKLQAEFNARVQQINDRISNLQCLEFNPSESIVQSEVPF
ncbi:hypothetical protein AX768_09040 [Burkholderia sp. PAMC 28687]|uniref:hypothetical protein n=1 Tax=Burkholderia sp. PAMC 28687 TaxID=1795874 RepID=UPI000785B609|nr:hypothetical protein [Burkholderia sp. PAMC 28687]AMM14216.1 hypothetical protein AX768_09040 [Burkholderia sp. PAMC 28687]